MKILKSYILELCFILSFALPFIKGANADNGRRFVEIYYGFTFLMRMETQWKAGFRTRENGTLQSMTI